MKLSRLLELHDSVKAPEALPLNFGDGYLVKNNRIFANLRKEALKQGFTYSMDRNEFYGALPLSQLESLLKKKVIPYTDNVSVLRDVESRIPGSAVWNDITDNLKKNHVFHETCHAVARAFSTKLLDTDSKVLRHLVEESFANTCELLAVIDAQDASHRIFFELNSYCILFEERTHLKNALQESGPLFAFSFFLLSYLHSNFLGDSLSEKTFARIIQCLNRRHPQAPVTDAKKLKALKALSRRTFELNPRFREVTTSFYFRLEGIQTPLPELLNFDFMEKIEKDPAYQKLIAALAMTAVGG
jgi:hypothetical protein